MKKIIPIVLAAILAVVLVISACVLLFTCYLQGTVAEGVALAAMPLEGKTLDRAKEFVMTETEGLTEKSITVSYNNVEISFRLEEIGAKIDWEDGVNQCYLLGKTGNVFHRCKDILVAGLKGTVIYPNCSYDKEALEQKLIPLQKRIKTPIKQATSAQVGDSIIVTAGEKGYVFDSEQLMQDILDALLTEQTTAVALTTNMQKPTPVSVETLAEQYFKDPVNAQYTVENGEISIIPDQDGVSFDKSAAEQLLKEHQSIYEIPLIYTKAGVTYADLDTNILKDTVATYTTSYGSGDSGRNYNVELAAERLNGVILQAGETFSFIEQVGDGSEAQGFRNANVYSRGEIVREPGGGLCQAASTLYSAVLYANLEIVTRTAHTLPVSYIAAGQDVTISSEIDFQFKNNQLFPIRILATTDGSTLTITLQGTVTNPNQTVTISNSLTETIPYSGKTVLTDELSPGEQEVIQNGTDGSVVTTYRIITENGKTLQSETVSVSRYEPIPKVIREGVAGSDERQTTEE